MEECEVCGAPNTNHDNCSRCNPEVSESERSEFREFKLLMSKTEQIERESAKLYYIIDDVKVNLSSNNQKIALVITAGIALGLLLIAVFHGNLNLGN